MIFKEHVLYSEGNIEPTKVVKQENRIIKFYLLIST